jgi:predicted glycosyltransferase
MKILQYCQHVLGIGHFYRSLEICRALSSHEVLFVTGGPPVAAELPPHAREIRLPGLEMDADFTALHASDPTQSLAQIKSARQKQLYHLVQTEVPDVILLELYPFGRKAFRFELDPLLEAIRNGALPPCQVICSLRDILVEKADQAAYEARVLRILNRDFHALLIHSDPQILQLDASFNRMADIQTEVVYTGFVTPPISPQAGPRWRRHLGLGPEDQLLVASAGGGKVGADLLLGVVTAFPLLPNGQRRQLYVFTGPYMSDAAVNRLQAAAGPVVHIARFSDNFLQFLAAADLSVSMGGYNTSLNIVATGVPALVWPFGQNREQRLRADLFARQGLLTVLQDEDLQPERLAGKMQHALTHPPTAKHTIELKGAANTARWLEAHGHPRGATGGTKP